MSADSIPTLTDLSLSQIEAVEKICTRFEKAWHDEPPRIEPFLNDVEEPVRSVLLAELVRLDCAYLAMIGESPDPTDYHHRFPNCAWLAEVLQESGHTLDNQSQVHDSSRGESTLGVHPSDCDRETREVIDAVEVRGYELLERLEPGGMGVVYRARHRKLNRIVALKMILTGEHAAEAERQRFKTEAEAIARLQHPGIVQIFEVGEHRPQGHDASQPFIALEFCSGGNLAKKLAGTPMQPPEAAMLVEQLAEAVDAAHRANVLHRDLKPANVLLTAEGTPKITDFGLAKKLDERDKTQTGAILGSPSYMPPEQAQGKGKELTPACDVYALGAILYECLTGRPPFKAATVMDTLMQVVREEAVPPRQLNAKVAADLETICLKCLRKSPSDRYVSAMELAEDLQRYRQGNPIQAKPVGSGERFVKWVKRNPMVASLVAAMFLVLVAGVVVSSLFAAQATNNAEQAGRAEATALQAKGVAEREQENAKQLAAKEVKARIQVQDERNRARKERDRAEHLLYPRQIRLAQTAWREGDVSAAFEQLDSARWDFRGWEHNYLFTTFTYNQCILGEHTSSVMSVSFSPDGKRLASASRKTVKVWDAISGKLILTLKGHTASVYSVSFSPDGKRIASASSDKTVKVWDAVTEEETLTLKGHTSTVLSVSFSPDGKRIASASDDKTVKVWNVTSGNEMLSLKGHTRRVTSVSFSPDGNRIASASLDATVKFWDALRSVPTHTLKGEVFFVHCTIGKDGKSLVARDRFGKIYAWDLYSGQPLPDPPAQMPSGPPPKRLPDGRSILIKGASILLTDHDRIAQSNREKLTRWARFDPKWHRAEWLDAQQQGNTFAQAFHLKRLVRAYPYQAHLHAQLAHVLAELGQPREATTHLMHALFLQPDVPLVKIDPEAAKRGEEAAQARQWEEAVEAFSLAAVQPDASPKRLFDLLFAQTAAGMHEQTKQTIQSIEHYAKTHSNDRFRAHFLFYAVHLPCGKWVADTLVRETAKTLAKARNTTTLLRYGSALYRAGKLDQAAELLAESDEAHPEGGYVSTCAFRAMVARDLGRPQEAQ